MTHEATDENNANAYYEDWLWGCKPENQAGIASNGQRVTTALALQIAADVLRGFDPDAGDLIIWTPNDMRLARAAIAGVRAQQGISETGDYSDNAPLIMLTHFCDIAVYG
jgi:hypothetical protein